MPMMALRIPKERRGSPLGDRDSRPGHLFKQNLGESAPGDQLGRLTVGSTWPDESGWLGGVQAENREVLPESGS